MRALLMPASLQHIDKAFEFGACIGVWVADRVAHAGLRCKMNHRSEPLLREQRCNRRAIGEIRLDEIEPRIVAEKGEPGTLQLRVILIVDAVETDHVAPRGHQLAGDVEADKARSAGDQYCVVRHLTPPGGNLDRFPRLAPAPV